MALLKYLIIHCTATPEGREISKEDIIRWHTAPVSEGGRGWRKPGYSDMIDLTGRLINIMPFNQDEHVDPWEITNGARGLNGLSRHVVYVGGMDREYRKAIDTRTPAQQAALQTYVRYMLLRYPDLLVIGHNQVAAKACPSFDVPHWLRSIGIHSKNIKSY